jgi:hypothetical protein
VGNPLSSHPVDVTYPTGTDVAAGELCVVLDPTVEGCDTGADEEEDIDAGKVCKLVSICKKMRGREEAYSQLQNLQGQFFQRA